MTAWRGAASSRWTTTVRHQPSLHLACALQMHTSPCCWHLQSACCTLSLCGSGRKCFGLGLLMGMTLVRTVAEMPLSVRAEQGCTCRRVDCKHGGPLQLQGVPAVPVLHVLGVPARGLHAAGRGRPLLPGPGQRLSGAVQQVGNLLACMQSCGMTSSERSEGSAQMDYSVSVWTLFTRLAQQVCTFLVCMQRCHKCFWSSLAFSHTVSESGLRDQSSRQASRLVSGCCMRLLLMSGLSLVPAVSLMAAICLEAGLKQRLPAGLL